MVMTVFLIVPLLEVMLMVLLLVVEVLVEVMILVVPGERVDGIRYQQFEPYGRPV